MLAKAMIAMMAAAAAIPAMAQPLPEGPFRLANAEAYCDRNGQDCRLPQGSAAPESIEHVFPILDRVNRDVNARLKFRYDRDQYGDADYWSVPASGYGDCEDYVLEKRRLLVREGVDPRNLRITLVRFSEDGRSINHALLGVVTDRGLRFLDMNTDKVGDALAASIRFGYRFQAIQSANDFTVYLPMSEPMVTASVER